MKYKDYKFTTSNESIDLTYNQACGYFSDTIKLINESRFDLFDEDEELSRDDASEKYNEINRRLQTLGQAFELFMKYIIHASRLEKNPNISIDELWNKWIRGHQMVALINEKANSSEVLPNFKEIFNLAMNSYYGAFGVGLPQRVLQLKASAERGFINPVELYAFLSPQIYRGGGALTDKQIEDIIEKNTAIYEKCRYNMQKMTNYNFSEVFNFIKFIKFFAKMIYISNSKTKIDYNVAYVHTVVDDPTVKGLLTKLRSEEEIEEILHDDYFNKDAGLLLFLLTTNARSLHEIRAIVKMSKQFQNPNNLYILLDYDVSIDDIKKCNEKGFDVMLLASHFTFKQIEKLVSIPTIGKYLNDNSILINKMVTQQESDIGLTFDDWYRLLNIVEIKNNPECLKQVILKYRGVYHYISKNKQCNGVFALPSEAEKKKNTWRPRDNRPFSQVYCDELISNIKHNIMFFKENDIDSKKFPVSIDSENAQKIYNLFIEYHINSFALWILTCPFNEVYAILKYLKKNNYDFSSDTFTTDFEQTYNEHSLYDPLFRDQFILDEFLEDNGLTRISEQLYCSERYGNTVSGNYNNPLPNLSGKK